MNRALADDSNDVSHLSISQLYGPQNVGGVVVGQSDYSVSSFSIAQR